MAPESVKPENKMQTTVLMKHHEHTYFWGAEGPGVQIFFVIPFYLQSVLVHPAKYVKRRIRWHVEECLVVLLCNE
jgi:hypothetical protein